MKRTTALKITYNRDSDQRSVTETDNTEVVGHQSGPTDDANGNTMAETSGPQATGYQPEMNLEQLVGIIRRMATDDTPPGQDLRHRTTLFRYDLIRMVTAEGFVTQMASDLARGQPVSADAMGRVMTAFRELLAQRSYVEIKMWAAIDELEKNGDNSDGTSDKETESESSAEVQELKNELSREKNRRIAAEALATEREQQG